LIIAGRRAIFPAVTNPLKDNYLVRSAWCLGVAATVACGGRSRAGAPPAPQPTLAIPVTNIAGQRVMVLPTTLALASDSLPWHDALSDRRATLTRADSVLGALLNDRAPEVNWVLPPELRRNAELSAGMVGDPGQFPTATLRYEELEEIPGPLQAQLRNLAAVSRARYGIVPAALLWLPTDTAAAMRAVVRGSGVGTAELTLVIVDTRLSRIGFWTVARGAGDDPWTALAQAVKAALPGLP